MNFSIRRGTNISHWLSQSNARGAERRTRFCREDAARLAAAGLDHLRLPVDEEQLWQPDGTPEEEAWDLLREGLTWCREENLRAIVDLHILRCHHFNAGPEGKTLFTDPAAARHFAGLWTQLSERLGEWPCDQVAYELLNEAVADDPEDWNRVLLAPYNAVREREPDRVIAIGSNRWGHAATFPQLRVPPNDPDIILVCHYYNPMLITHYRASWVAGLKDYAGPIRYPGTIVADRDLAALEPGLQGKIRGMNRSFDKAAMQADLEPAVGVARQLGLPLWCNEFGVIANTPDDIRHAWYRDFMETLAEQGIPWTNWDFRGGFGLYDRENRPTAAFRALLGNA